MNVIRCFWMMLKLVAAFLWIAAMFALAVPCVACKVTFGKDGIVDHCFKKGRA